MTIDWLTALTRLRARGDDCVLVTVVEIDGSAPREVGARMVVTAQRTWASIGGGNLEYRAIRRARALLADDPATRRAGDERYALGASLGQCCGGHARLLFEPLAAGGARSAWIDGLVAAIEQECVLVTIYGDEQAELTHAVFDGGAPPAAMPESVAARARGLLNEGRGAQFEPLAVDARPGLRVLCERLGPPALNLVLFGAGHVGRALVAALADIECTINWVDARPEWLPEGAPPRLRVCLSDAPEYQVDSAPPGSFFLVMTHSHALDFRLCERILARGDFAYLGMIGSTTKRARLEQHLARKGIPRERRARLTCPIGIAGIGGKRPVEIAIAVAAEILRVRDAAGTRIAALDISQQRGAVGGE